MITMSEPRLPAAPPHGPALARMSAAAQAASAGDALGLADGAIGPDGAADGETDGPGLGLGVLPQAPTSNAPNTAKAAMRDGRWRLAYVTVGLIKRLQRGYVRTILPEHAE